ncbi:MAG: CpsD/CapB family tyrosine-protein kinase [Alphaproteobacteria bacterium]|nr:CpsD/CapB family tyrosine-protein kinase [Alphaproteobacteria bacterium]
MDRLEKAIEKARAERATVNPSLMNPSLSGAAALARGAAPAFNGRSTPVFAPPSPSGDEPDEAQMERNRVVAHHTRSPEADIYRQLRTQVLHIMNKEGWRSLAITSPNYGDGKTTVALNLGISIALDLKQTVMLVDLDLRKPAMHRYLGLNPTVGLTDYLVKGVPLTDCLTRPPFERLNTLPAGSALDNSSELLASPRMIALAHELKTRYPDRLIIYDMPPVLNQDDPIAFLPQVDAVLVVVRDGVTRSDDLKRCLANLAAANVIGTVLNVCQ